jgi:hypothetical protein
MYEHGFQYKLYNTIKNWILHLNTGSRQGGESKYSRTSRAGKSEAIHQDTA